MEKTKKNYANGKIYKIEPICEHEESELYYGSTTQPLSKRFGVHKSKYINYLEGTQHKYTVFDLFDKYGVENCKIYLVEDYPCERKEQSEKREGEIIRASKCVNQKVAGRKPQDYREENRELINNKAKLYRKKNHQIIKEKKGRKHQCACGGSYTQDNKAKHERTQKHNNYINNIVVDKEEKKRIRNKKYQLLNSEQLVCECGMKYTKGHKTRHLKTFKHQDYLKEQEKI